MVPRNGTTSTAPCNGTLLPRPIRQSGSSPSPPIGSKNPYSYRYLGKKKLGTGTSITPSASAQVDLSNSMGMVPNFWDPPAPRGKELFTKLKDRSASSSAERTFWVTQSGSHRHLGRPAEGFFVTSKPKVDLLSTLKTVVEYGKE